MITSRQNPKIKQMRALRQSKERRRSGLCLVEGIRPVAAAIEANAEVAYICYAPQLLTSEYAQRLIAQQEAMGIPCHAISDDLFRQVTTREHPAGVLAVVRQRWSHLDEFSKRNLSWVAALIAPQDPGNVGSILRTVDAAGVDGLLLLDGGVDPYHPTAVRAAMGAQFWVPLASSSFAAFADWAQRHGYHIYGTSAHGAVDYRQVTFQTPGVLLLGSEREGLSTRHTAVCETIVRLPMHGRVTSLNLAVAAGILLYAMAEEKITQR
jgi:TrmH family RNA methyltransferase